MSSPVPVSHRYVGTFKDGLWASLRSLAIKMEQSVGVTAEL